MKSLKWEYKMKPPSSKTNFQRFWITSDLFSVMNSGILWIKRVLLGPVRTLKRSFWNSNQKISAHPDVATPLLQILTLIKFQMAIVKKEQLPLQPWHRRWFVWKRFGYYSHNHWKFIETFACLKGCFSGYCLRVRQAVWVLARSQSVNLK